jgi:hypothetical protein
MGFAPLRFPGGSCMFLIMGWAATSICKLQTCSVARASSYHIVTGVFRGNKTKKILSYLTLVHVDFTPTHIVNAHQHHHDAAAMQAYVLFSTINNLTFSKKVYLYDYSFF